jgi:hypothetical protein
MGSIAGRGVRVSGLRNVSTTDAMLSVAPSEPAGVEYLIVVRGVLRFSFRRPRRSAAHRLARALRAVRVRRASLASAS